MTTVAAPSPRTLALPRTSTHSRTLELLLYATAFTITFAKVRVEIAGAYLFLSDVTALLFVLGFLAHRVRRGDWTLPRTAAILTAFFAAFLAVYLFALLIAAVAFLARRSARLYWQTLALFLAGFVANAVYGLLQLTLAETTGGNLDERVLGALGIYERGGILLYGNVGGAAVYRTTALTLDPNHLGVMLVTPILVLLPLYLRLERGHRLRTPIAVTLAFLAFVELTTLSRSGLLGIAVGVAVLAVPYRHLLLRPRVLVPLGALALVVAAIVLQRTEFFRTIFEARTSSGSGTRIHFEFYELVRPVLADHPLFGLGLNTFSVYYEFVTGRTNYGPHSFYVATLTETGLVGAALFVVYLAFIFRRLSALRRIGRALSEAGDRAGARVRPLAWGLTAALVGTMAANLFYLTMQMYYFYLFAVLVLAAPAVFARRS
jgi:O-antigen ligase